LWRVEQGLKMDLEERHRWWKPHMGTELRALLMTCWDPIGVNDAPEAQSEYDGYLGPLMEMLSKGADAQKVARYLANIQTEDMDLPATPEELRGAADRIVGWYASQGQG
jgi:hypothetical protein